MTGIRTQIGPLVVGRAGAAAVSAAWLIIAARSLPSEEFGALVLLLALGGVAGVVIDFGYSTLLPFEVARHPALAAGLAGAVIRVRLLLAVPASVAVALAYLVVRPPGGLEVPAIFSISILATAVYTSYVLALRGLGRTAPDGVNEVASRLLVLGIGTIWLLRGGGLLAAVASYAAADTASALALHLLFRRTAPVSSRRQASLPLRRAAPAAIAATVGVAYYRIDTWMLGLLQGATDVGIYGAAYRLFEGAMLGAVSISAITANRVAAHSQPRGEVLRLSLLSLALTIPGIVVVVVWAPDLLALLFGPSFAAGSDALRLLGLAAVPSALGVAVLPVVTVQAGLRTAFATAIALVVNVALNLRLIPSYGPVGAAASMVFSQAVACALLWALFLACVRSDNDQAAAAA